MEPGPPVVCLGCPLCLSSMELELGCRTTATTDASSTAEAGEQQQHHQQEDQNRPAKRLRRLSKYCNPLDAHRHYCPYKCGFPNSVTDTPKPVWKVILERVCREKDPSDNVGDATRSQQVNEGTTTENAEDHYDDDDEAASEAVMDSCIDKVRQILRAGLAPKTVDLSEDSD
mmetsp:Transcript_3361/g.5329  ORF Transcript_3361/g.5329 Transcript_3361/m.5329 type:complete len:172 (+) Transcript_3361:1-516(+)